MKSEHYIGMLSGTSRDGVDAVLAHFNGDSMHIMHAKCVPYPTAIKLTLDQLIESAAPPDQEMRELLDENLGRFFARVAQDLVREAGMEMRDIKAIGSHGQTVWHDPDGSPPVSVQLGKPGLIARGTNTTVVGDFRSADMRADGQGAPLAPLLHQQLFSSDKEDRAVLNIGGIANLTLLPANGEIGGFDCGPGNCLLDLWTNRHLHKSYDTNGNWAAKGTMDQHLLTRMLQDPYFSRPAPKSTGLEYFNSTWLSEMTSGIATEAVDVQSTLVDLTAHSIARSLADSGEPARLLVCGGGVNNAFLMRKIRDAIPRVVVEPTNWYGVHPDWVEGLLFAWLARERLNDSRQNTAPITGATREVLLGDVVTAPARKP